MGCDRKLFPNLSWSHSQPGPQGKPAFKVRFHEGTSTFANSRCGRYRSARFNKIFSPTTCRAGFQIGNFLLNAVSSVSRSSYLLFLVESTSIDLPGSLPVESE